MQTYSCQHCGLNSSTTFDLFLHIFTQHMHKDLGLTRKEVRRLLREGHAGQLITVADPQLVGALGAALHGLAGGP